MDIQKNVPLAPYTTFKIGGAARYFCDIHSFGELAEVLKFACEKHLSVFVLGGGSNILIADEGFDGLVVHFTAPTLPLVPTIESENDDEITLSVDAGMQWDAFVEYAVEHNYYGIENLSGIPGTIGGAVVANIGAYSAQVSDTFVRAETIDREDPALTKKIFTNNACAFAYHESVFSHARGRYVIVRAIFTLVKHPVPGKQYRDNRFFIGSEQMDGTTPALREVREKILAIREQKGALAMEGRQGFLCAGSFFHMPFVSKEAYFHVLARAEMLDSEKEARLRPWAWEQADGRYKLAPGFLLEYTQFQKGYQRGGVGISPLHTLSIINLGHGTAREVAQLASDMNRAVEELFAVSLEREVEYVGNV